MKKLITIFISITAVFILLLVPTKVEAKNSFDISVPETIDISDEETSFVIAFNSVIEKNCCIRLSFAKELTIKGESGNEYILKISSDKNAFSKTGDEIIITITHEPFEEDSYTSNLDLNFTLTAIQTKQNVSEKAVETIGDNNTSSSSSSVTEQSIVYERKTMYVTQDVLGWDTENYSETPLSTTSKEMTQYAYEPAQFSDSVYSDTAPEDGIYIEKTMYGYKERTKTEVQTPYSYEARRNYNNIGACPGDCVSGTQNFYGSGCECVISYYEHGVHTSFNYGEWNDVLSSYRFDEPYSESDTVSPVNKTVYLTPVGFDEAVDWTFEVLSPTNTQKVTTRTVYVAPVSLSSAASPSDTRPVDRDDQIVTEVEYCRIVRNDKAEEWKKCN